MDLRERLSDRIHIEDIHEILRYVQGSQKRKSELYGLIFDPDETIGYQALWACSPFTTASSESPTGGFPELLPRPDAFSEGITRCANALHETGI